MDCELPGGAWREGQRVRAARLRPLTGALEQALQGQLDAASSWPEAVSGALTVAVASIGKEACSRELIDSLSVADRQYLLLTLARLLGGDVFWSAARCPSCQALFDLELRRSQLPVKPAAEGFPFVDVQVAGQQRQARVPTGADQLAIVHLDEARAVHELVARCLLAAPGLDPVESLSSDDIERIGSALDDVAADVGTFVATGCPECGAGHVVAVDPFGLSASGTSHLYREVHALALCYHWSEAEILALPRERRHLYLSLIEEDQGRHD